MTIIFTKPRTKNFLVSNQLVSSREAANHRIAQYGCQTFSNKGNYRCGFHDHKYAYVYHLEKVRPKFRKSNKTHVSSFDNKYRIQNAKKVIDGGWTLRIYRFELDKVKKIEQHTRHFQVWL